MKNNEGPVSKVQFEISVATLIKITVFALSVVALFYLRSLVLISFLAVLLAVGLEPVVWRMERWLPRGAAIALLLVTVFSAFAAFVSFLTPPLYEQFVRVIQKAPGAGTALLSRIPESSWLHRAVQKMLVLPLPSAESWAPNLLTAGQIAIGGLSTLVLVAAIMAYLLIDGKTAYAWALAFFSPKNQAKLKLTAEEVTPIISAYIVGQVVTSLFAAIFTYAILKSFDVPAALLLAFLAGIFDVLPIVGFFLSVIPAALFALTVSPKTAVFVLLLYCVYHAVENYLIVPLIYGNRLRVSGLVVLLAILVGVTLGGILGALVILPIVASYPVIEKIWLHESVGQRAIAEHRDLEAE